MRLWRSYTFFEQIELQAKLLNYFLGINKSNINQLELKRSTDRDEGFLEVKDAEANQQHKSIIGALKAAAPEWEFEQINFVVGNRGS